MCLKQLRNLLKILIGNSKVKSEIGEPKRRGKDIIVAC
jgi:hypothetical protein